MEEINLILGYDRVEGGARAVAVHAAKAFDAMGYNARIVKPGSPKGYGEVNCICVNSPLEMKKYLLGKNTVVIHRHNWGQIPPVWQEYNELIYESNVPIVIFDKRGIVGLPEKAKTICNREQIVNLLKNCNLVPFPFVRNNDSKWDKLLYPKRDKYPYAVSHTRVAKEKNLGMVLDANSLLPEENKIYIVGLRWMRYVNFVLKKKYPDWEKVYLGSHETCGYNIHDLLSNTKVCVDMSYLEETSSSIQYSFLEIMDAGSYLIINKKWIQGEGDMVHGHTCEAVENSEQLANAVLNREYSLDYRYVLEKHSPENVIPKWIKVING